jgi:O-antigen/teichoic acid export membrane protein
VKIVFAKFFSLLAGAVDGLAYPFAIAVIGPVIVHLGGTQDYSKVAAVMLMSSIGALFNIVGAQGVIYSLAREDVGAARRSAVLTAILLVTVTSIGLCSSILIFMCRFSGIGDIFSAGELTHAAIFSWGLCLLISVDGVLGGVLKARRLIKFSAGVEFGKSALLLVVLFGVSRANSWSDDCMCLVLLVACSVASKWLLIGRLTDFRLTGLRRALKEIRLVTRTNIWQWVLLLSAFFFQQADRLILASRLGAADFAVYNFCWQISFVLQSACAASLMYILPLATAGASGDQSQLFKSSYAHDVRLGILIATILAVAFWAVASVVFHTPILPQTLRGGFHLFVIMSVCMYVSSFSVVPYYYLVALGGLPSIALVNVTGAGLSFLTALLAVGSLGVTGLALSKAWSVVTLSCYWFCRTKMRQRDNTDGKPAL